MTDESLPDEYAEIDPWVIPLPEVSSARASEPAGSTPPGPLTRVTGAAAEPAPSDFHQPADPGVAFPLVPDDEEFPTEGFHPRLRRSA